MTYFRDVSLEGTSLSDKEMLELAFRCIQVSSYLSSLLTAHASLSEHPYLSIPWTGSRESN